MLGHPYADLALGTVELRLGLKHIERGAEGRWRSAHSKCVRSIVAVAMIENEDYEAAKFRGDR
jgi:hypothetical protein